MGKYISRKLSCPKLVWEVINMIGITRVVSHLFFASYKEFYSYNILKVKQCCGGAILTTSNIKNVAAFLCQQPWGSYL